MFSPHNSYQIKYCTEYIAMFEAVRTLFISFSKANGEAALASES